MDSAWSHPLQHSWNAPTDGTDHMRSGGSSTNPGCRICMCILDRDVLPSWVLTFKKSFRMLWGGFQTKFLWANRGFQCGKLKAKQKFISSRYPIFVSHKPTFFGELSQKGRIVSSQWILVEWCGFWVLDQLISVLYSSKTGTYSKAELFRLIEQLDHSAMSYIS